MTNMSGHTGNVVERQTKADGVSTVQHIVSQSTYASIPSSSLSAKDDQGKQSCEDATLLPEESITYDPNVFIQQLLERGYEYDWEGFCGFKESEHCSLHYVRHIKTDTIYVAKIVSVATFNEQPNNVDPCEKAEIAEYLAEYNEEEETTDIYDTCRIKKRHNSLIGSKVVKRTPDSVGIKDECHIKIAKDEHLPSTSKKVNKTEGITKNDINSKIRNSSSTESYVEIAWKNNILRQCDWFVSDDSKLIMIYENCEGGNLHTKIMEARRRGMDHFEEAFITDVFTQVCRGVAYMHKLKFVHGDIKASNVLISCEETMEVKIGDYDTCHHISSTNINEEGTLMYTAPELALDSRITTNFASDVWALGCLLYEMLTLQHPFDNPCSYETLRNTFCEFEKHKRRLLSNIPKLYSVSMHHLLDVTLQFNPMLRVSVNQLLYILGRCKLLATQTNAVKEADVN